MCQLVTNITLSVDSNGVPSLEYKTEHADVKGGKGYGCMGENGGAPACLRWRDEVVVRKKRRAWFRKCAAVQVCSCCTVREFGCFCFAPSFS